MAQRRIRDTRRFSVVANDLFENPKLAPFERRDLHTMASAALAAWIISNDTGSDGEIVARTVLRKCDADGILVRLDGEELTVTDAMIAQGMWHAPGHDCPRCPQPRPGRLSVHDIGLHQRLKAEREELSAKRREYGAKGLEARWGPVRAAKAAKAAQQGQLPLDEAPPLEQEPPPVAKAMASATADAMASAMASTSERLNEDHAIAVRAPRPNANRGRTKIREDFTIDDTMRRWAKTEAPDAAVDIDAETQRFVKYWRGRGVLMDNWAEAWRSWMLGEQKKATAAQNAGRGNRGPYRNPAGGDEELAADWGARKPA